MLTLLAGLAFAQDTPAPPVDLERPYAMEVVQISVSSVPLLGDTNIRTRSLLLVDFALEVPNHHWQPQSLYVPSDVDYVGKIESYRDDFRALCERVGLTPYEVPSENRTKHGHYTEYYTPRLVDRIGEAHLQCRVVRTGCTAKKNSLFRRS